MKRWMIAAVVVVLAAGGAAGASHEDPNGFEQCEYAHESPHYGLKRDNPNDPASWVSQGDPNNPWVGSTSPTGAVYAGRFGGSEGNALLTVGSCLEHQGAGSHGGTSEVSVYQKDDMVYVVAVAEGGNDDPAANGYIGANTGYDRGNGRVNKGGRTCAGQRSGANACTPVDTPLMCEPATAAGGPPSSSGGANWHNTTKDGCDLRN